MSQSKLKVLEQKAGEKLSKNLVGESKNKIYLSYLKNLISFRNQLSNSQRDVVLAHPAHFFEIVCILSYLLITKTYSIYSTI